MSCECADDDPCFCPRDLSDAPKRKVRMSAEFVEQVRSISGDVRWPLHAVEDER